MEGIWLISYIVLWLVVLALIVLVLLLYRQLGIMYLGTAEGVSRDGLNRGTSAPDFTLTDQYGHPQRLAAMRGKPAALLFGSPSCGPCRLLAPQLDDWAKKHPDINVVWLNAASSDESARFVAETGLKVPVAAYSPESKLLDLYKVRVTPFIFMLDEVGVVRAKGLVNNKGGLDIYYRELKTGKFEPAPEEEAALQEVGTH
jgi:methylamine dehydrogenase accessory protein MauD